MNILVTDFDNTGDDVMIFTEKFTPESVVNILTEKNVPFTDCFQVQGSELQYYLYDPCWI